MSNTSSEKRDLLVAEMGWTKERAQGYVDGETTQISGVDLPSCHQTGMDDYSKGFRTGYYTQACSVSIDDVRENLVTH